MLSPSLSQLFERARTRFGLEVEILDAGLTHLYPESGSDFARLLQDSPTLRRTLLDALAAGRAQDFQDGGSHYRVYPLRAGRRHHIARLVAVKRTSAAPTRPQDAEPWSELTRAVVEADLAALDSLGDERDRARRLFGALRLLEFIAGTEDETAVTEALIQAAAVWYDVDARVYRRNLDGNFILQAWLPAIHPDERSKRLLASVLEQDIGVRRIVSLSEFGDVPAREAVLAPLVYGSEAPWLLVLLGSVPADADSLLRIIGRSAGNHLQGLSVRRAARGRQRFEQLISEAAKVPELVAVRAVQDLVQATGAATGSLTLTRNGQSRRIAAVGRVADDDNAPPVREWLFSSQRLVCPLTLSGDDGAVLELRAARGSDFTPDSAALTHECASVLRAWLAGSLSSLDFSVLLERTPLPAPGFSARIEEELERAKRFDLRLSLILIDVTAPSDTVAKLRDALRRELRGSDVTGTMSGSQVAALLTHTDAVGLDNAVRRIKQRLADAAMRLNVANLKLGQAAFSPECRTAHALLELALNQAEPVIVH